MIEDNAIKVILVDKDDNQIGTMEKMAAHQNGATLHRAFSIFVFNSKGETLLQQRAMGKYHARGMWSNTCCSHPFPGEAVEDAAHRRLKEEMGFDCPLEEEFSFTYRADLEKGMTEHEFDHVFFGKYEGNVNPEPKEVMNYKWVAMKELMQDTEKSPNNYTPWLILALKEIEVQGWTE
ncbi:MAG TPA: isopentenyl-diphosphate Delta-isomerase [Candidatus Baltobacteraceae bacterium]|nr:isopentenyl-diphosphate Delta-isomerase [Candidatus Baltobacteraceae bacterium]